MEKNEKKRYTDTINKLKSDLGRFRNIERKMQRTEKSSYFQEELIIVKCVLQQARKDKNKRYSLHAPEIIRISQGKAHKKHEYRSKGIYRYHT